MKKIYIVNTSLSILAAALITGCGSHSCDTSGGGNLPSGITNIFQDSLVLGLPYSCSSGNENGDFTNENGEFICKDGDTVSFNVGDIALGEWKVNGENNVVTPYDLSGKDPVVMINIAQLLQTMDADNNPANGIIIKAGELAKFDNSGIAVDSPTFDAEAGAKIGPLVSEAKAEKHLIEENPEIPDIVPPIISINGKNHITVKQGTVYADANATAHDVYDILHGGSNETIETTDTVDTDILGDYTLTYTAEDIAGNKSEAKRTVTVAANIPVITILGANPVNIRVDDTYIDAGATAHDAEDGDITGDIKESDNLDVSKVGSYNWNYKVTDSDGHTAKASRVINVAADLAPVVTLKGDNPLEVGNNLAKYVDPGATAEDPEEGSVTPTMKSNDVNTSKVGTYSVVWSAKDSKGHEGTATRVVNVVDKIAPVVTLIGDANLTQSYGNYIEPGATAMDETDGNVTGSIVINPEVNATKPGTLTVTYTATDSAGNKGKATRTVTINACQTYNPITGGCEDLPL